MKQRSSPHGRVAAARGCGAGPLCALVTSFVKRTRYGFFSRGMRFAISHLWLCLRAGCAGGERRRRRARDRVSDGPTRDREAEGEILV